MKNEDQHREIEKFSCQEDGCVSIEQGFQRWIFLMIFFRVVSLLFYIIPLILLIIICIGCALVREHRRGEFNCSCDELCGLNTIL